jgi:golgin subfamily B member 1
LPTKIVIRVFYQVSDTNAELVKLVNQVALLEEEKGNLQLSLVDFDELKGRNQDKRFIADVSVVLVILSDF